ncbi:MAG: hypothetical protein Fues2KO_28150 [Fuerstiella sp.]
MHLFRSIFAALLLSGFPALAASDVQVERFTASEGFDGQSCWVHARAGLINHDPNRAIMTTQKLLLSGSDVFYALHQLTSDDGGRSWTKPVPISSFERQTFTGRDKPLPTGAELAPDLLQPGDQTTVCDFVPQWHASTNRILGIGQTVWYRNNRVMHVRPRGVAYAVYDHTSTQPQWSKWDCVDLPDEERFRCAGAGSQQRVDLDDGTVLIPIYAKTPTAKQYESLVIQCSFNGETLKYQRHGNGLSIPVDRGLYEPSLVKFGDQFLMTLRNDRHGYVASSDDGQQFKAPKKWRFDDGQELGNYNTQQHWLTGGGKLYLVYTRKGANNDHVFRHRAPLFMAEVDVDRLCVLRNTERVLVPERGARLGNFGVTQVSDHESWVTVTEWMQPAGVEKHGSDNTIWVARVSWPNHASEKSVTAAKPVVDVPADLPKAKPEAVGMDVKKLDEIDAVVAEGIAEKKMPGCVVMIGHQGHIVYHKAFGHRQLVPQKQPMKPDTVFDMASLTKPIATATSIMTLVDAGKLDVNARVSKYVPEFAANGKQDITVHQLLTHMGGLIPDNSLKDYLDGPEKAFERIYALGTYKEPGTKFVYTDVGFIMLADIVKRLTGQNVHEYSQQKIFGPLGMTETGYVPPEALRQRAAVTQERDGQPMRGQVHDPRAWELGGIAGHAGLFSTAKDLSRYAQMMINGGTLDGVQILSADAFQLMTEPVEVSSGLRTRGWDMNSPYSSNRGETMSDKAFGHGGFTGTAMWIDPELELFVIFLSNRVHPDGKGSVNKLAGRIGTIAADSIQKPNDE